MIVLERSDRFSLSEKSLAAMHDRIKHLRLHFATMDCSHLTADAESFKLIMVQIYNYNN